MESIKKGIKKHGYIFILLLTLIAIIIFILLLNMITQSPRSVIYKGIRYDNELETHLNLGTNQDKFTPGDDYPNFSSVVAVFNNYLGLYDRSKPFLRKPPTERQMNLNRFTCSGVLINEKWVLTVAECVLEKTNPPTKSPRVGVVIGDDYLYPIDEAIAVNVYIHPAYLNYTEPESNYYNLALMELEKNIQTIEPANLARKTQERVDQVIYASGYGEYNVDKNPIPIISKRGAYQNVLDRIVRDINLNNNSTSNEDYKTGIMAIDFDSIYKDANTLDESFNNVVNPLLDEGDSNSEPTKYEGCSIIGYKGGPAFQYIDGEWKVIGIYSYDYNPLYRENQQNVGYWDYGTITVFILISEHIDWIESIMEYS
jgi:hypothetical protein